MKKSNKILLIIFIFILVLWFGSNLGLYLFTKYFVVGEESLELINKVPETIEIDYKEFEGKKIYLGDLEFTLPFNNYESVILSPNIDINQQEVDKYTIFLTLIYKHADRRSTILIHLWKPDLKFADSYIELSNFTFKDFSIWNTVSNYNLFPQHSREVFIIVK